MCILLPLIASAVTAAHAEDVAAPQAELAAMLAKAESIDRIETRTGAVVFSFDRCGEAYRATATTRGGEVVAVALTDVGAAPEPHAAGRYTWLARELANASVANLTVGDDGIVTLATRGGVRYELISGRDGNAAVSARWAAAWDE